MALAVAGTSLAATANPFDDVPAKHWAYDSIQALAKAGIVDGFGDGAFKGDKPLTRYEMAVIVAKAMSKSKSSQLDQESQAVLAKLKVEFGDELKGLGVRVDKLEKTSPSIKISGRGQLYYAKNDALNGNNSNNIKPSYMQEEIFLDMESDVSENVKFKGTLQKTAYSNRTDGATGRYSSADKIRFDQAEFLWTNKNYSISAGRIMPFLGQGMLWCWTADGAYATYDFSKVSLSGGYVDLNTYDAGAFNNASVNAAIANLTIKATDNVNFTVAYLDALNPQDVTTRLGYNYNFRQVAYGVNTKLGDFTLAAETIKNHADSLPHDAQRSGWLTRLQWKGIDVATPGSYGVTLDYMKFGNWSIDPELWGHLLMVTGGDAIGGNGAKGYGATVNYVAAKNIDVSVAYYKLKPYDSNKSGFTSYKDHLGLTTNFKF
ncbi:S-layer homology domain-containing protein [Sporomusa sp.]|uniref:S-layer homology domain-containing protein n=1 Tax=Sporomusa sp. TaxID=2078658 RepID=UPI002C835CF8|nr:S-layer homology domain-containing protein [Sporomusa sp.]HWR42096.1 S-layer homology domain-containing protein [Sporomusa sp.]